MKKQVKQLHCPHHRKSPGVAPRNFSLSLSLSLPDVTVLAGPKSGVQFFVQSFLSCSFLLQVLFSISFRSSPCLLRPSFLLLKPGFPLYVLPHNIPLTLRSTCPNHLIYRDVLRRLRDAVRRKSPDLWSIGASITTMLQHIPRTWLDFFFGENPDSFVSPGSQRLLALQVNLFYFYLFITFPLPEGRILF